MYKDSRGNDKHQCQIRLSLLTNLGMGMKIHPKNFNNIAMFIFRLVGACQGIHKSIYCTPMYV
jgi:hypothetical protein